MRLFDDMKDRFTIMGRDLAGSPNMHGMYESRVDAEYALRNGMWSGVVVSLGEYDDAREAFEELNKDGDAAFVECCKKQYWDMLNVVPPARSEDEWFFVGEPYMPSSRGELHSFYFRKGDRYFHGLRPVGASGKEIREWISGFEAPCLAQD